MKICVLSRKGRGGQFDPHVFHLGQRRIPVIAIVEQWTEAQYRYVKVRVDDGRRFVLRQDCASGEWELVAAYSGAASRPAAVVRL
jgi:hypothetical protein